MYLSSPCNSVTGIENEHCLKTSSDDIITFCHKMYYSNTSVFSIRKSIWVFKKLASRSWPVLFALNYFSLKHIFSYPYTLLFCWKIKSCCHRCFSQQIRPQITVQLYSGRSFCKIFWWKLNWPNYINRLYLLPKLFSEMYFLLYA